MVKKLPAMQEIWVQCLGRKIHGEGNVYLLQYNFSLKKKKKSCTKFYALCKRHALNIKPQVSFK